MEKEFESNEIIDCLPDHLRQFIKPQDYQNYTAIDQAVWRYVMRENVDYLSRVAHKSYLDGLKQTGISIEHIPNMYGMNRILKNIGWAAVAVDGFIPPAAFMEFQAFNVLVIASDIRQLEHIEYTPAPDILHEAAGHAPIIANPEYAEYLRRFGEIGCKAISNAKDHEIYEAIRHLSIIKEAENIPAKEIKIAEKKVDELQNDVRQQSEMAQIRNLHWWTVEYGLIGTMKNPKMYGAGLLSSIGENQRCMSDKVKKIPYNIDAAQQDFDITRPQPQLYVTPDFAHLSAVLEEFANKMAVRLGGLQGIKKLIQSKNLGTIELSTGIQISGEFSKVIEFEGKPIYFQTTAKTALAYRNKELIGHGVKTHSEGFGSPLGRLKGINLAIEDMSPFDLRAYTICEGKKINLEFEGGVVVKGELITGIRNMHGKIILISLKNCIVSYKDEILFQPEWGQYDMAIGKEITSAFAGPADFDSFDLITHQISNASKKSTQSPEREELDFLYESVRNIREGINAKIPLKYAFEIVCLQHPQDWLLSVEIYELAYQKNKKLEDAILQHLGQIRKKRPRVSQLIEKGIELVKEYSSMLF